MQPKRFTVRLLTLLFSVLFIASFSHSAGQLARAQGTLAATFGAVVGGDQPAPTQMPITATPVAAATDVPNATPTPAPTTAPAAQPAIPPQPSLHSDQMGIQVYANLEVDRWWGIVDRAQFMGFKWIKFQVSWKELEPVTKGEYSPTMTVLRDNMIYAGRRGFKMMLSIVNAPDWARPAEARGQQDGPPANPQDYADFVGAVLDQFGTQYISAVELWNEPNLQREWTGQPISAASYRRYFDVAYNAIRARSGSIVVLTAGLAPTGAGAASVDDRQYLRDLYKTGLPLNDPNFAIGVHPYGWANAPDARCCAEQKQGWDDQPYFFFLDNILTYRQIMVENNHAGGKLWGTEFGWSTFDGLHYKSHIDGPPAVPTGDPWMNRITEQQQAEYVVRAFELAQTGDLAAYMGPMMLWNMNFASLPEFVKADQPSRPESGYSVLDSDWGTRLVYRYLEAAPKN